MQQGPEDLSTYRTRYVETLLKQERGELDALDWQFVDSVGTGAPPSRNIP